MKVFEGILPNKKFLVAQLNDCGSVRYDALDLACKIMSEACNQTTAFGWVAV